MGGGHARGQQPTSASPVAAHVAIVATLGFVGAVVSAPRGAWAAYLFDAGLLAGAVVALDVPRGWLLHRTPVLVPVAMFALWAAVVGPPPRLDLLGLQVSREGLASGTTVLAKASLGLVAASALTVTVAPADLLAGLDRLRFPRLLTAVAGFMVRYLEVIGAQAARMRVARLSRADDPRWLWQARATAGSLGVLFVRSYERGERVQLAMLARGYTGQMPAPWHPVVRRSARGTASAACVVAASATATVLAWVLG